MDAADPRSGIKAFRGVLYGLVFSAVLIVAVLAVLWWAL
jgi:hypothetical protein